MPTNEQKLEAENVQLLARIRRLESHLESCEADHSMLMTAVYVAARQAGLLDQQPPTAVDYLALAKQLGEKSSRPAPKDTAVTLSDLELEVAAKGANLVQTITEDRAKAHFKRLQLAPANSFMEMATAAKNLASRLTEEAKARGIDTENGEQIVFGAHIVEISDSIEQAMNRQRKAH